MGFKCEVHIKRLCIKESNLRGVCISCSEGGVAQTFIFYG